MGEPTTERPGAAERPQESGAAAPGRGGRMSRSRKRDAVLRLLCGEDLETVSRLLGITASAQLGFGGRAPAGRLPRPAVHSRTGLAANCEKTFFCRCISLTPGCPSSRTGRAIIRFYTVRAI